MSKRIVEVKKLSAGYGGNTVLYNISFELNDGELLLVYGESGSGKTTLIRVLAGVMGKYVNGWYKGYIRIGGVNPYSLDNRSLISVIAYIPQEPWYGIISPTVEGEVIVNQLLVKSYNPGEVEGVLSKYGLETLRKRLTYTLSAGETQKLLVAANTVRNTTLYLFDEPNSYLDENARKILVEEVLSLVEKGATVIVVDHYLDLWIKHASRILLLEQGKQVYFGSPHEIPVGNAISMRTGTFKLKTKRLGEEVIRLENIYYKYPATRKYVIRNLSFTVKRSSITWIKGPNGSGKTTLLKIISGLLKPNKGRITRTGNPIYVPENPLLFFSEPTIKEELYTGSIDRKLVDELVEAFHVKHLVSRKLKHTSSGERRRIALISAMVRGYDIICLDEPTAGLDLDNRLQVLEALVEAAEKGYTIIIAGHDPLLREISDNIIELTKQ